jgi:hypothetical protein
MWTTNRSKDYAMLIINRNPGVRFVVPFGSFVDGTKGVPRANTRTI